MSHNRSEHIKKELITALEGTMGIVTTACKKVGISRTTFYEYYNNDQNFKDAVDDLSNVALDFVESQLFSKIREMDTTAIIFYLKTKGKKRGYIERQEIDNNNRNINIVIDKDDSQA